MTLVPIDILEKRFGVFAKCELDLSVGNQYNTRIYVVIENKYIKELDFKLQVNFLKIVLIDDCYSILVYKININHLLDYNVFLKGQYSLLSNNYKQLLVWSYNITPNRDIFNTLYPSKIKLIQKAKLLNIKEPLIEYSSKPNLSMETFTVSKLYGIK